MKTLKTLIVTINNLSKILLTRKKEKILINDRKTQRY